MAERHERGGLYLEDFCAGAVFRHPVRRTVTEADNVLFSTMTMNPQPLHIDAEFCRAETEWGRPLVNSLLTLGLLVGISVADTTMGTTIGNLGLTDVRFPHPLFHGDTLRVETTVVATRRSKSRPMNGIVTFEHRGYNQAEVLVAVCRRQALMLARAAASGDETG